MLKHILNLEKCAGHYEMFNKLQLGTQPAALLAKTKLTSSAALVLLKIITYFKNQILCTGELFTFHGSPMSFKDTSITSEIIVMMPSPAKKMLV